MNARPPFRVEVRKATRKRYRVVTISRNEEYEVTEWRWTMRGRNGRIVGASSEGFSSKRKAIANLLLTMPGYQWTTVGLRSAFIPEDDPRHLIKVEVKA